MLKLENIHTSYGRIEAIRGISLEVSRGEIVCLIGSNGAGKSTTLMTVSGILKPLKGSIIFKGENIRELSAHRIVGRGISQVPEGRRIFPRLTVLENLEMGAFLKSKRRKAEDGSNYEIAPAKQIEDIFDLFPVLKERKRQLGGTLSGGEQQMLAIGRSLMARPDLLLLDEPSLGLAPIVVSKIFRTIRELNAQGLTILLVEQNAKAALKLAHRGYVIESGKVTKEGKGQDLLDDPAIKKAYLGE
ncbi:MAG: ABC transporter ATP-binding protein [Nitrospiraceae bacterium]|nr:MAG: ABC transporter ATP-binding protein [Nitrospiraceae bacterium]